jgi:uncharacterized protein (UPF0248 family)
MIPAREFLTKIKWDTREDPAQYTIRYLDFGKPIDIPYAAIKDISQNFMTVLREGKESDILLHNIRQIKKAGAVAWQR